MRSPTAASPSAAEAADRPVTLHAVRPGRRACSGAQWAGRARRAAAPDHASTWAARRADIGLVTEAGVHEASARATRRSPATRSSCRCSTLQTIGAGGGSIACVDEAGAFSVGPRSAGADPGPACYGLGGTEPTITDAHLVLGRHRPRALPRRRDDARARTRRSAAIERLAERLGHGPAETAEGVLTIANANMAHDDPLDHRRARPRPARLQRSSRSAARARCTRPSSPTCSSVARGADPAAPGHHLRRRACSPPTCATTTMRTVFMRRGRDRRRRASTASFDELAADAARAPARATAPTRAEMRGRARAWTAATSARATSCASPWRRGLRRGRRSRRSTRAHGAEYGHALQRPDRDRQPARHGHRAPPAARRVQVRSGEPGARRTIGEAVPVASGASTASSTELPTRHLAASGCRSASRSPAPRSSSSATPPSSCRRDGRPPPTAAGPLCSPHGGGPMTTVTADASSADGPSTRSPPP